MHTYTQGGEWEKVREGEGTEEGRRRREVKTVHEEGLSKPTPGHLLSALFPTVTPEKASGTVQGIPLVGMGV